MEWNPLGRRNMLIPILSFDQSSDTGSLEIRERKVRNKHNELLLENVLAITIHDSNVILHMH